MYQLQYMNNALYDFVSGETLPNTDLLLSAIKCEKKCLATFC